MASHKQKVRDCELFPHAKKKWIETIDKLMQTKSTWMDNRGEGETAEEKFEWWISRLSLEEFQERKSMPTLF